MRFKQFLEVINFKDPNRQNMARHPYVQGATFGVEIEFACLGFPDNHWGSEDLVVGLRGSSFEERALEEYMAEKQEEAGEEDYSIEDDTDFYDYWFEEYIRQNFSDAIAAFWNYVESGEFRPDSGHSSIDANDGEWLLRVTEYWAEQFEAAIEFADFDVEKGQKANGKRWAVGSDGNDSDYNFPMVEIRTGILNMEDLPKFKEALEGIVAIVYQNDRELQAFGNTGLHIHVHNPRMGGQRGYYDAFARLAVAQHTDENEIWDQSASHERAFERYAKLNDPSQFSSTDEEGGHSQIISVLDRIFRAKAKGGQYVTIPGEEFSEYFGSPFMRNVGMNIHSEHPTLEYRYLSSMMLLEDGGVDKVIEWIKYFVENTASNANKDQIKFQNDQIRYVLTKLPNDQIRIDRMQKANYHHPDYEEDENDPIYRFPRVKRSGYGREDLDRPQTQARDRWEPVGVWWRRLARKDQEEKLQNTRSARSTPEEPFHNK